MIINPLVTMLPEQLNATVQLGHLSTNQRRSMRYKGVEAPGWLADLTGALLVLTLGAVLTFLWDLLHEVLR